MGTIRTFLFRISTPLTVGLFLVSAVSGIALYFHVGTTTFRAMHEDLSMVWLVPIILHLWRNWKVFANYFRTLAMPVSLVVCLLAAGFYAYDSMSAPSGANPAGMLIGAAQSAPLSTLAPFLKLDEATAFKRLADAGIDGASAKDSVRDLASRSGRNGMEILGLLASKPAS
jgi:hypothetical protein